MIKTYILNRVSDFNGDKTDCVLLGPDHFNIKLAYTDFKNKTGHYSVKKFAQFLIENFKFRNAKLSNGLFLS